MNSEKEKKSKENETITLICNPIPNQVNPKRRREKGEEGEGISLEEEP